MARLPEPPPPPDDAAGDWPYDEPADFEDPDPHSVVDEQWLLSALMQGGEKALDDAIGQGFHPDDFYRPFHQEIAVAIAGMCGAGERIDPLTLRDWLGPATFNTTRQHPTYLFDLWQIPATWMQAGHFAGTVHELAMKRRQAELHRHGLQMARDPAVSAADAQARSEQALARVTGVGAANVAAELRTWAELAADDLVAELDEVIPGMVGVGDKIVVVGGEGSGKSMIGAQAALCCAAGVHPFLSGMRYTPSRTLVVDLELSPGILARRARRLLPHMERDGLDQPMCRVWHRPAGIDLRTADGQAELTAAIRAQQPRLLALGPVYKCGIAYGQAEGDDYLRVLEFLDRLKTRFGFALWLEQHAPMRQGQRARELRPEGTGLWLKWPDFGWALYPAPKRGPNWFRWHPYRPPREERTWPEFVYWRPADSYGWPWQAQYPEHAFEEPLPDAATRAAGDYSDDLAARRARHQDQEQGLCPPPCRAIMGREGESPCHHPPPPAS